MQTVTITRHYSGFRNREDSFEIGDHERDGNASATVYVIPEGYRVDRDEPPVLIRDPDGYECAIVEGEGRRPKLVSRGGNRPDVELTPAAP